MSGTTKAKPQLSKQGSPMILYLGSATKPAQVVDPPLTQKSPPEIHKGYWHIIDQMENQPPQGQTSTLEYPIVD